MQIMEIWKKLKQFTGVTLWSLDAKSLSRAQVYLASLLRLLIVLIRDLNKGQLNLRAMSLVYTTLLSLVPLLALSFSVLKGFGVHNMIEPALANVLSPLGEKGGEVTKQIIEFVENINVGVLGSLGLAFLLFTVVSLVQKIESSFNYIWSVQTPRNFAQRFSQYLSVILVGPVLVFTAMGITASLMNSEVMQTLQQVYFVGVFFNVVGKLVPYFFAIGAFTFFYSFIPNTNIFFRAALTGGIVAGILWNTTGYAFAYFVVSSTKYTAIYSGFAILIILIIWIYLSWLILLFGAQISFYTQRPEYIRKERGEQALSNRYKERLALAIMFTIAKHFYYGKSACTADSLILKFHANSEPVQRIIELLRQQNFIMESSDEPPGLFPTRSLEQITVSELLLSVRQAEELSSEASNSVSSVTDRLIQEMDQAWTAQLKQLNLKDLVLQDAAGDQEKS